MMEDMVIELVAKEKTYSSKEVVVQLGIGSSTLRKWCMLLEQHNYRFHRDVHNRREFHQIDTVALREFMKLAKTMALEHAAISVVSSIKRLRPEEKALPVPSVVKRSYPSHDLLEEKVDSLVQHIEKQDAFNIALLDRLEKQEKYISINLKERDRRLTKAMNDILDTKITLTKLQDKEQTKSIWHRLFRIT